MEKDTKRETGPALLGVETSSPVFSVSVCRGKETLSFLRVDGQGRPSTMLTELIEKSCDEAGIKLSQLDGFAISIGPGSFTGLRVGVATVKTLAWALKKKVIPVSSLEVIARNMISASSPICPFVDARKGKVYTALFSSNGSSSLRRFSADQLISPEELLKKLKNDTLLVGDGLRRYGDLVDSLGENSWTKAPEGKWIPSAENVCRIAADRWAQARGEASSGRSRWPAGVLDDPHRLVPQYLYSKESDITGW